MNIQEKIKNLKPNRPGDARMIALVQSMFDDIEIKGAAIVTNATKQEILSWLKLRNENDLVAAIEDLVRRKRIVEPERNVKSNVKTKLQPEKRKVAITTQTI
jgi:hypothetical protein